jgi:hypothetical protein
MMIFKLEKVVKLWLGINLCWEGSLLSLNQVLVSILVSKLNLNLLPRRKTKKSAE